MSLKLKIKLKNASFSSHGENDDKTLLHMTEIFDENTEKIKKVCQSFVGHILTLHANFSLDDRLIQLSDCNAIGNILQEIFYHYFKKEIIGFERGPPQSSPDYWTTNRTYEYELKCYQNSPGFDIANYTSYIHQLADKDGVFRKLFRTKYLVFKYIINNGQIIIKEFTFLNVWNIVGYTGLYPITLQCKKHMWYNIRPSSSSDWTNPGKNPRMFMDAIIRSIEKCPNNIRDRDDIIHKISEQIIKLHL
jgi:hypothetical protein